jgi:translation initiation factor IF-2
MADKQTIRLFKVSRELNVGITTVVDFLQKKGHVVESNPNTNITSEQYQLLLKEFAASKATKKEASSINIQKPQNDVVIKSEPLNEKKKEKEEKEILIKTVNNTTEVVKTEAPKLQGLTVKGKIDLDGKKNSGDVKDKSHKEQHHHKQHDNKHYHKHQQHQQKPIQKVAEQKFIKQPVVNEVENPVDKTEGDANDKKTFTVSGVMANKKDKDFIQNFKDNAENDIVIEAKAEKLQGLKILGKIELPSDKKNNKGGNNNAGNKPVASSDDEAKKRKRKRIKNKNKNSLSETANVKSLDDKKKEGATSSPQNPPRTNNNNQNNNAHHHKRNEHNRGSGGGQHNNNNNRTNSNNSNNQNRHHHHNRGGNTTNNANANTPNTFSDKEIQEQIKNTLARLNEDKHSNRRMAKREKKLANAKRQEELQNEADRKANILKVTEFISVSDLAALMNASVNEVIAKCLSFGMFVSINQRLDAEAITIIADEFGYDVEFTSADQEITVEEETDLPENLSTRAPIVTIMGHVDHGKTSLLDFIRRTKVVDSEAGGITQHIGAYDVKTKDGRRITFLDTPGHEAFTAMRARGAKVTDVAIIVIAADDSVMPQTREAINHAQNAGVPIVFAMNKIDKPGANVEKIRKELAEMNMLVESWGGKYQEQEISAKKGIAIDDLLEKVLIESELLDLKANPNRRASGAVIEAELDKGKGYVTTVLVQNGTLRVGDAILAGSHFGKVRAMYDHVGKKLKEAPPSMPVQVIGLNGAPQAGDKFNVMESEREAREIATKRGQLVREQNIRTTKRTTLTDLGRRIALGNFKQLNLIIKGDVDGSVEALSDSLLKISTEEIEVKVIHKGVGQISESDVLLAAASDAIIIGFQVRPSANARKLVDKEEVDVRLYSIIYDAINEVRDAMEGMLAPTMEENIVGNVEIREVFKISKVGTVAGCMVTDGYIKRTSRIRIVRDGIVVFGGNEGGGELASLKRFKDDVNEVRSGFDCGLGLKNFNDIRVGDTIEVFEQKEVKRKL